MSYVLFWLETFCAALLSIATAIAFAGRLDRRMGGLLVAITVVIVELCLAAAAATTAALKFGGGVEANGFAYALSLFVASILGAIVLLWAARRRRRDPRPAQPGRAGGWRSRWQRSWRSR